MGYSEIVAADIRLCILQALAEDADYSQNEHVLDAVLSSFGHSLPGSQLRAQVAWLEEQGLVTLGDVAGVMVAQLTRRGMDVAAGRANVPGVRRPGPGEQK